MEVNCWQCSLRRSPSRRISTPHPWSWIRKSILPSEEWDHSDDNPTPCPTREVKARYHSIWKADSNGLDVNVPRKLASRFFFENSRSTASQRQSTEANFFNGNCWGYSACRKCSKNLIICIRMYSQNQYYEWSLTFHVFSTEGNKKGQYLVHRLHLYGPSPSRCIASPLGHLDWNVEFCSWGLASRTSLRPRRDLF